MVHKIERTKPTDVTYRRVTFPGESPSVGLLLSARTGNLLLPGDLVKGKTILAGCGAGFGPVAVAFPQVRGKHGVNVRISNN
jgi:hypothetical protein